MTILPPNIFWIIIISNLWGFHSLRFHRFKVLKEKWSPNCKMQINSKQSFELNWSQNNLFLSINWGKRVSCTLHEHFNHAYGLSCQFRSMRFCSQQVDYSLYWNTLDFRVWCWVLALANFIVEVISDNSTAKYFWIIIISNLWGFDSPRFHRFKVSKENWSPNCKMLINSKQSFELNWSQNNLFLSINWGKRVSCTLHEHLNHAYGLSCLFRSMRFCSQQVDDSLYWNTLDFRVWCWVLALFKRLTSLLR